MTERCGNCKHIDDDYGWDGMARRICRFSPPVVIVGDELNYSYKKVTLGYWCRKFKARRDEEGDDE